MNRELITVIEQMGREKGIDKEILFEALESALLSASRKTLGASDNWRMHIDRKSGDLRVYCRKKVVTEVTDDKQTAGPRVDDVVDPLTQRAAGGDYVKSSKKSGILAFR